MWWRSGCCRPPDNSLCGPTRYGYANLEGKLTLDFASQGLILLYLLLPGLPFRIGRGDCVKPLSCAISTLHSRKSISKITIGQEWRIFSSFSSSFTILNHSPSMDSSKVTGTGYCCTSWSFPLLALVAFFHSDILLSLASIFISLCSFCAVGPFGNFDSVGLLPAFFYAFVLEYRPFIVRIRGFFFVKNLVFSCLQQVFLDAYLIDRCFNRIGGKGYAPLLMRSCIFQFKANQSSIEWLMS